MFPHPHRERLPIMQTELRLIFKYAPQLGFANLERRAEPNQLLAGSWGALAADTLVAGHAGWRDPWVES